MKRLFIRSFLKCIPILALLFIAAEFFVTNHLAGLGGNVGSIDQKIAHLREQNELLRQSVASSSALVTISDRAVRLGFIEPTHVLTIGPEQSSVAIVPHR
mgnify:FL=1